MVADLTPEEGKFYDNNGFLHVPDALTPEHVAKLRAAADRVDDWSRGLKEVSGRNNLLDFIGLARAQAIPTIK